jgi:hypothetical protein
VLRFTATPSAGWSWLEGHLTYVYPLRKAQAENYFKPIRFVNVLEFDPNRSDEAIAAQAIAQLRADFDKGHILMARVDTIARADNVFALYERYPEFNPVKLHTQVPARAREEARQAVVSKRARIVVCVDMLGGDSTWNSRSRRHDIRKSLAVTLQPPAFTRSRPDLGDATYIATADDTIGNRGARMLTAIGRLRSGASLESAENELSVVSSRFAAAYPAEYDPAGTEHRRVPDPLR